MKKLGYILVGLALLQAVVIALFGLEETFWFAAFGVCMLTGSLLLFASFLTSLTRGDIRLRPVRALTWSPFVFSAMFGIYALVAIVMPDRDIDLGEAAAKSALFALVFSVYITAYRRVR